MGLLSEGTPLSWEETKKYADYVREHGIKQFINQYHKLKDRSKDSLLWGDEVEYMVVAFDKENKTARLSLQAQDILSALTHDDTTKSEGERHWTWHPEYAAYMVEATPGKPYGSLLQHLNLVEASMRHRRQEVQKKCRPNDKLLTLTAFPRLGCPNFSDPPLKPTPGEGVTHSLFIPDDTIFAGHPRFKNLTRNIRQRRGEKVAINIPIFKDTNTKQPFVEDLAALGDKGESARAALPDHIYMDAMAFGMGCCCLQMTFQACSIDEARMLYDQLTPLTPIILALSAASPIQRGYLSDVDCRWNVIAASVDDRTREERGLEPLRNDRFVIPKSRYDSIDSYLSSHCGGEHNNDMPLVMDHALYQQLVDGGVDHLLSQHIAHLFIRDPVSLFSEKINQDDERDTDHFENIQSTNWQTMRFKPPPAGSSIGWRVEFRPMEVQLTDFENAAFVVFIVLITRIILSFQLNLVIPISKVDENMKRAQRRDAVRTQTFFFKKDLLTCNTPKNAKNFCGDACVDDSDDYSEMTVNEIINGKPGEFSGIIPLIQHYLEGIPDRDVDTMCTLTQYLSLIKKRASGELKTMARWTRDFVLRHPDYRHDSVVSERITYDLVSTCADITDGKLSCPELLMKHSTKTSDALSQATLLAESTIQDRAARRLQQPDGAVIEG